MAQRALNQETISCPICLDLLKDPVTLPCGHSYCMDCIQTNWEKEQRYSCPQCREVFVPRPVLVKSTVLANIVEELKTSGLTAPLAEHCYAAPEDVSCDICTGRKLKAISSCLQCLLSYCEPHLQPHRDVNILQKHQLVAPSDKLQENLCSEHNEVKKLFCQKDQQIICYLCSVDHHKGHDTVSSAAERAQRQTKMEANKTLLLQSLQEKETELKKLQQEAQDITCTTQETLQKNGDFFNEMVLLIEKKRSEVEQTIKAGQEIKLNQVQELKDQLQQDIAALSKAISEMDSLALIPDHNQFIMQCTPFCTDMKRSKSSVKIKYLQKDFQDITEAVLNLKDKLKLSLEEFKITEKETQSREDFLRYAHDITLDPNTANAYVTLSDENRRATVQRPTIVQSHPDRFDWCQVMSSESLTGRCYWEVELNVIYWIRVAVSYNSIKRKGRDSESGFGDNDKSWALRWDKNNYSFWFNGIETKIPISFSPICGVYLDQDAGVLSFYSVKGENMDLLHRVQTNFNQPLFAGVWMYNYGDAAHFLKLK